MKRSTKESSGRMKPYIRKTATNCFCFSLTADACSSATLTVFLTENCLFPVKSVPTGSVCREWAECKVSAFPLRSITNSRTMSCSLHIRAEKEKNSECCRHRFVQSFSNSKRKIFFRQKPDKHCRILRRYIVLLEVST